MSPGHVHDLIYFRIGLRIALDKSYSNSYEHMLYIYKSGWKKLSFILQLGKDGPKKWMDKKKAEILLLYYYYIY